MSDAAPPLSADDYKQLYDMSMSEDASVRAQASTLAKKLTPSEYQQFFDMQRAANKGKGEVGRQDNTVLGMPPEMAAIGAAKVGQALAQGGVTLGSKMLAGGKAAIAAAAPTVKYEATKTGLQALGFPAPLAAVVGTAVAGYNRPSGSAPSAPSAPMIDPAEDARAAQVFINAGMSPSSAAMRASGGNPSRFAAILSHMMKAQQVK